MHRPTPSSMDRRRLLQMGAGAVLISTLPQLAYATPEDMASTIREVFGDRPMTEDRVSLKLPPLAENGYSVSLSVSVDSPMTDDDFVKRIVILSPQNPIPHMATFHLGPRAGKAEVETRVRLGGTQTIRAIAEMNDETLWIGTARTIVTLAACVLM